MGLLFRAIFREVAKSAIFGALLFTFVLFLQGVGKLFEILVRSSAPRPPSPTCLPWRFRPRWLLVCRSASWWAC